MRSALTKKKKGLTIENGCDHRQAFVLVDELFQSQTGEGCDEHGQEDGKPAHPQNVRNVTVVPNDARTRNHQQKQESENKVIQGSVCNERARLAAAHFHFRAKAKR
jgi:hypothetical protein